MNQSQINFIVKTLGADEAARELQKLEKAAQKAGSTVKQYLKTSAGESDLIGLQSRAAQARAQNANATQQVANATNRAADATDRNSRSQAGYFGHIAKTTVQSALINKLFLEFVDVSGQAIQQVDLMNNFPATMASMGESTADASSAMDTLRNYVGQVGGNLGDATSYVTRFTGALGDVKAATAVFVGLNNALIAGDSSLEEQKQAAVQFAQALERGKPDLREWRTLTQNMSFQLDMVAKSMGYVNANELGEALSQGEESMAAFTTALTKMATGTGPIAEQARARMSGMQFSFNVLKNTMVQGLAAIIQTIGRENIVSFFTFLTQVVQVLTQVVVGLISALVTLFNFFAKLFGLPAIKLKKDVEGVAQGLGSGAGAAEDLGDGLKDAGDEAKALNKSLASFDKMNVLPDKTSGKGKKDEGAGGAGFDAGQLGELGDLFGDMGGKLAEAGKWAKIFAGIIAGIAGIKFAQAIIDQIAGIANSFATARKGLGKFKDAIVGTTDEAGKRSGGLAEKIGGLPAVITGKLDGMKGAFAGLGKFLTNPYVLAAAAVAIVVGALKHLYDTNEDFKKGFDSVWKGIGQVVGEVANILKAIMQPALDGLKKAWDGLLKAIQPVTITLQPFIDRIKEFFANLFPGVNAMEFFGKAIGVVAGVIAAIVVGPIAALIVGITLLTTGIVWLITKIIEIGTAIATYIGQNFTTAKDAVVGFVTGGIDLITGAFNTAKDAVVGFITGGIDFVGQKFQEFMGWVEEHKQALINWGIVITTFLLPKIVQIGAEFAVMAAKAAAELAKVVASSVANAAKTSAAWVTKELPKIIAGFAKASASATVEFAKMAAQAIANFVKMSAQAVVHGAKIAAAFAASAAKAAVEFGLMVVKFVAGLATMAAQLAIKAAQMAISWALALGPVGLAIAVVAGAIALIIANWDLVRDTAVAVFEKVKEVIQGAIDWVKENWPLLLAILTGPIGLFVLAVVKNWDQIKEAFNLAWEGIKAVWNTVVDFFKGVWEGIKLVFAFVIDFYKNLFQNAWNAIVFIWTTAANWFGGIWNGIKGAFAAVGTFFRDIFQGAWDNITRIFGGLWSWFKTNVWDRITGIFGSIGSSIGDAVSGAFKGVINTATGFVANMINNVIRSINGAINIINKIPGVSIGRIGEISLPRLARGGIVDQPTAAIIGEQGKEAIVPLENNLEWIDKLAAKINTSNTNGQPVQLTVQIGEEKIVSKVIELINEKTQMSGRNMIYV